jgi:hypothetical protein
MLRQARTKAKLKNEGCRKISGDALILGNAPDASVISSGAQVQAWRAATGNPAGSFCPGSVSRMAAGDLQLIAGNDLDVLKVDDAAGVAEIRTRLVRHSLDEGGNSRQADFHLAPFPPQLQIRLLPARFCRCLRHNKGIENSGVMAAAGRRRRDKNALNWSRQCPAT